MWQIWLLVAGVWVEQFDAGGGALTEDNAGDPIEGSCRKHVKQKFCRGYKSGTWKLRRLS